MKLLSDLVVLDLSSVLAGPSAGTFFAELGAKVIKVENLKRGGDVTNSWRLPVEKENAVSAYYSSVNFNKEVHLLDLTSSSSQDQLSTWLAEADVVLENFKAKDRVKFGVDPTHIKAHYPSLIHCHLRGFEHALNRVAYDVVLQAETGFMSMNGTKESGPVKMPVAMIDVMAAHQMKEAVLLALYKRATTNSGSYIELSLEASGLSALVNQASNFLMADHVAQRMGSKHPNIAPYGELFSCADGKMVVLAIGSDAQFGELCAYFGLDELMDDDRFATNAKRVVHRAALEEKLKAQIEIRNASDFLSYCHAHQLPVGEVKTMDDVLSSKTAQEMIREEIIHGETTKRLSSIAFRIT